MSTKLLSPILQQSNEYTLEFYCPGCKMMHCVYLKHTDNKQASWDWNMCSKWPTFSPSLLIQMPWKGQAYTCHFFIRDGKLQYLDDCSHELKGQTIPMMHIPEDDR